MWIYSQGLATIYYKDPATDTLTIIAKGYSGLGVGLNSPTFQCQQDLGPLPRGLYKIKAPKDGPTPYSLPLSPQPGTDMCNPPRHSFLIHGDRNSEPPRAPNAASHGCIILSRNVRETIWNSGDDVLLVVEYSP